MCFACCSTGSGFAISAAMNDRPSPSVPEDPNAALRQATALREAGDAAGAANVYRELTNRHPREAGLWALLGDTLRDSGDPTAGAAALETASVLSPADDDIAVEWALAVLESGDANAARDILSPRLGALVNSARAQAVLADACRAAKDLPAAIKHYQALLALTPENHNARISLGVCLQESGAFESAVEAYYVALAQEPNNVLALSNLGLALAEIGNDSEARHTLERAAALAPTDSATLCNLGTFLQKQGETAAAVDCYERAITASPDDMKAWSNLGNARQDELRFDDALTAHDRAVAIAPNDANVRWNRAMTLLLSGDLAKGFTEYEWRTRTVSHAPPQHESPRWDGSDLKGKRLLLLAEQGFGDAIQFVRYAPLLQQRGAEVVIQCHPKLADLFATSDGAPTVVATGTPIQKVDAHVPLMSLPHLLGTTVETVPAAIPYLHTPANVTPPSEHPRIGLCWTGNPDHPDNMHRSCPIPALDPLLTRSDIDWCSLQFGPAAMDVVGYIPDDPTWTAQLGGFANTAMALQTLDLVITVDTATAHLAGALGRPVWLMLKYAPDWRWMTKRTDSPWYPTMRLFRQPSPGDWTSVIADVESALETWMNR